MPAAENFRVNLATAMELAGISQYKLAEASGVARPHLNGILNGNTPSPGIECCERLAAAVGIPLTALLLDPKKYKEISRTLSAPPVGDVNLLAKELSSPKPPPSRGRGGKKINTDNRILAWVNQLRREAAAG